MDSRYWVRPRPSLEYVAYNDKEVKNSQLYGTLPLWHSTLMELLLASSATSPGFSSHFTTSKIIRSPTISQVLFFYFLIFMINYCHLNLLPYEHALISYINLTFNNIRVLDFFYHLGLVCLLLLLLFLLGGAFMIMSNHAFVA